MALAAGPNPGQHGTASRTSIAALPPELLERICSLLPGPYDLASCHLVDTRFCKAARAALVSAEPQHPGFFELALHHCYPLRRLNTAELPWHDEVQQYLTKAPSSLTSLDLAQYALDQRLGWNRRVEDKPASSDMIQGISSLRFLSCSDLDCSQLGPHHAGLKTLLLITEPRGHQGLTCLTNLTRLLISGYHCAWDWQCLLDAVSTLTTLQSLHLPPLECWPMPSPLSALSRLTSLGLITGDDVDREFDCKGDEEIAALVEALPQLRALELVTFADLATDAGFAQLSKLSLLRHLSVQYSLHGCTYHGLNAALWNMTGLEALEVSACPFMSEHAMTAIARLTSLTALLLDSLPLVRFPASVISSMLAALGPRLRRLAMSYSYQGQPPIGCQRLYLDGLLSAILMHCPLLAHVDVGDVQHSKAEADLICARLTCCTQMSTSGNAEADVLLLHVPELRYLQLHMDPAETYSVASLTKGLQSLPQLCSLSTTFDARGHEVNGDPLHSMLEAVAPCSKLTHLQLSEFCSDGIKRIARFGVRHLRALAALSQLVVLNLHGVPWEEEPLSMELRLLADSLPHLCVFNAPRHVLGQVVNDTSSLEGCSYQLRGAQGRRLRRWPRRSTLIYAVGDPVKTPWPVLDEHRWLWDD